MSTSFHLRASFRLALIAMLSATVLSAPRSAQAFSVIFDGTAYDVEIYRGSYDNNPRHFETPANNGRMPWWGNTDLADNLAYQLAAGLSSPPYPNNGPLFASAFVNSNRGNEVVSSYFDFTSLGTTNIVTSAAFSRESTQAYVVTTSPVPAPIPLAASAVCISAMRRLRRLSTRLQSLRSKL